MAFNIYSWKNHQDALANYPNGLTVRDRIIVHLADYSPYETQYRVPREVSQQGIADAVGIKQRHISQNVRPMINEGLVKERSSYIEGGRQHQKVYFLTSQGRTASDSIHNGSFNNHSNRNNAQTTTLSVPNSRATTFKTIERRDPRSQIFLYPTISKR